MDIQLATCVIITYFLAKCVTSICIIKMKNYTEVPSRTQSSREIGIPLIVKNVRIIPARVRPKETVRIEIDIHNPTNQRASEVVPVFMICRDFMDMPSLAARTLLELMPNETQTLIVDTIKIANPGSWNVIVLSHAVKVEVEVQPKLPDFKLESVESAIAHIQGHPQHAIKYYRICNLYAGRVFRLTIQSNSEETSLVAKVYHEAPSGTYLRDCAPYKYLSSQSLYFPKYYADDKSETLYLEDLGESFETNLTKTGTNVSTYLDLILEALVELHSTNLTYIPEHLIRRVGVVEINHIRWIEPIGTLLQAFDKLPKGPENDAFVNIWYQQIEELESEIDIGIEGLIHGDLHGQNLFLHDGKIKFIDLPGINIGGPEMDLVHFIIRVPKMCWSDVVSVTNRYLAIRKSRCGDRITSDAFMRRFVLRLVVEATHYVAMSLFYHAQPWLFHTKVGGSLEDVPQTCALIDAALEENAFFKKLFQRWQGIFDGEVVIDPRNPLNLSSQLS